MAKRMAGEQDFLIPTRHICPWQSFSDLRMKISLSAKNQKVYTPGWEVQLHPPFQRQEPPLLSRYAFFAVQETHDNV